MPPENMPAQIILPDWLIGVLFVIGFFSVAIWGFVFYCLSRDKSPIPWTPRRHVPWNWTGALLAAFCLWMSTVQTFASFFEDSSEPSDAGRLPTLDEVFLFTFSVASLAAATAYALIKIFRATRADFGLPDSFLQLLTDSVLGIAMCIAMLVPVYAVQSLVVYMLGLPSSHPTIEQLIADPSGNGLLAAVIGAVIVAPLFEEFAFRVLLQGWLERIAGPSRRRSASIWPIFVSSFFFAITHQGQGAAPIALFILALGLGYLYRQTHRYAPCVVAHAFFNGLSLLLAWASSVVTAT